MEVRYPFNLIIMTVLRPEGVTGGEVIETLNW
jgi:hypothetical protein